MPRMLRAPNGVPPLEFGNRAFFGATTPDGNVVVIDSPSMVAQSAVPIDAPRDVLVHAAYLAAPPTVGLLNRGLRGVIAMDAGIGRNESGVGGLGLADAVHVPAASVSVFSAEMCVGRSVWDDGVISRVNAAAAALGVQPGFATREAAMLMLRAPPGMPRHLANPEGDGDFPIVNSTDGGIHGCWSMGLPRGDRARDVFCVGTPVDTTMTVHMYNHRILPRGVIGSDGGFGRAQMAIAGLQILQDMGIACAAVSHLSAELGNARSIHGEGIISIANAHAEAAGVRVGMAARDAAALLLRRDVPAARARMIRPAAAGDAVAVAAVVHAAYRHYVARIGKPPGPMLDDYPARIANGQVWVLEAAGAIAGVLVLERQADRFLLDNVAVPPDCQGSGFGRALMDFAEAEATRGGWAEIVLYTHVLMTENQALYRRLGYAETGRVSEKGFERVYMTKRLA